MTNEILKEKILNGDTFFYKSESNMIEQIKSLNLTEDEWLQAFDNTMKKYPNVKIAFSMSEYFNIVEDCAEMTVKLAKTLSENVPYLKNKTFIRVALNKDMGEHEMKNKIEEFLNNPNTPIEIKNEIHIRKETWDIIRKNIEKLNIKDITQFLKHPDCPISVRHAYIQKDESISALDIVTADDILYWNQFYQNMDENTIEKVLNNVHCNEWEDVVTQNPELFRFIKKPNINVCKAAIKSDGNNIIYCKNPNKTLIDYTIKIHPEMEKQLKNQTKTMNKKITIYNAPYYFVKFREELFDYGELICIKIIKGSDMDEFMKKSFILCFGDISDDKKRNVKDCAILNPITKEKAKELMTFGIDGLGEEHFIFS